MKTLKNISAAAILLFVSQTYAYLTTSESGEITPAGKYKIGAIPQIRLSGPSGMNFTGFIDTAINDESSARVHIGTGETDFYAGASYKWIPIPDFNQQPAIGGKVGFIYGRESDENITVIRAEPLVSKKFDTEIGLLTPYASLPINIVSYKSKTDTAIQIAIGTEFEREDIPDWGFGAEMGVNAKDSFGYLAFLATYTFDGTFDGSSSGPTIRRRH